MSRLICSAHSSGVPATDSFSASSGLNMLIALATSPAANASNIGCNSAWSMPWRASCSGGIDGM